MVTIKHDMSILKVNEVWSFEFAALRKVNKSSSTSEVTDIGEFQNTFKTSASSSWNQETCSTTRHGEF